VLWTTQQWAAWPRGISKTAASIFRDPLVFYTVFPPIFVLFFNAAWPQRATHQSRTTRALYILWRVVFVTGGLAAYSTVRTNWTHFAVSPVG
jgi:uncharacterized membrane protein YjdF